MIECLRCKANIQEFRRVVIELPIGGDPGHYTTGTHALLVCGGCGHMEIIHLKSHLLQGMREIAIAEPAKKGGA